MIYVRTFYKKKYEKTLFLFYLFEQHREKKQCVKGSNKRFGDLSI